MSKAPKLRFKEFSGDWEEDELGNIIEISKSKYNPLKNEEDYKCIELENLSQETGQLLGYFNSKEQQSIKNKFNKGEVLFGKLRPYLKKYWLADFEGVCSSEIWVLNGIKASNNFIYRLIQTDKFNFISNISSGSKMPRADWSYMREFPFFIPKLEEQEKIASFFSLIDDKISLQGEKVEALKDYKKGMMQKIFSRELRFKDDDGRDYPEWEDKKLGDIANITMGQSPSSSCYNEEYIGLPLIQGNADIKDRKTEPRVYTSEITKTCDIGDIIMSVRAPVGAISMSLHNACIGRGVCSIKTKYSVEYVYQFLLNHESKWSQVSQGSTFESVNSNDIKSLKIPFPNLDEQKKIGNFLGNIDNKIEKEQEKLDSLNEYKKGLLQQMFV